MATRRKRVTKPEVLELIAQLKTEKIITDELLLAFAEKINGGPFPPPKPMSMATAKKKVLSQFGCKTVTELRKI